VVAAKKQLLKCYDKNLILWGLISSIPKYVKELGYSPAVSPDPKARDTETIFQIIKK
jgi:hypothetical protein